MLFSGPFYRPKKRGFFCKRRPKAREVLVQEVDRRDLRLARTTPQGNVPLRPSAHIKSQGPNSHDTRSSSPTQMYDAESTRFFGQGANGIAESNTASNASDCQMTTPALRVQSRLASLLEMCRGTRLMRSSVSPNGNLLASTEEADVNRPIDSKGSTARDAKPNESSFKGGNQLNRKGIETGSNPAAKRTKSKVSALALRRTKKYIVRSYLLKGIRQFPRKYPYMCRGRKKFRTVYTMPLRLSMSRFVSNKFLKGYYNHLSRTALSKTAKGSSRKKEIEQQTHQISLLSGFSPHSANAPSGTSFFFPGERKRAAGSYEPNPTSPKTYIAHKSKNEVGKKFLIALERRLDSTILRSVNSKPRSLKKRIWIRGLRRRRERRRYQRNWVKSP